MLKLKRIFLLSIFLVPILSCDQNEPDKQDEIVDDDKTPPQENKDKDKTKKEDIFKNDNLITKNLTEQEIENLSFKIENKYREYTKIDSKILAQIILGVPEQGENPWACGYIGSWHVIDALRAENGLTTYYPKDLHDPGKYQFSVEFKTSLLDNPFFERTFDNEVEKNGLDPVQVRSEIDRNSENGIFRAGSLPIQMAEYIKERIPKEYDVVAVGEDNFDVDILITVIRDNIDKGAPLFVVIQKDKTKKTLHYYNVVGISNDGNDVIILDSDGKGIKRLDSIKTSELLRYMNISRFKKFSELFKKLNDEPIYSIIKLMKVKLVSDEEYDTLKNYNYIAISKM